MIKQFYIFLLIGIIMALRVEEGAAQGCNAEFTWTNQCNVVQFNSTDPNNGLTYKWTFGDGDSATIKSPSHIYYVSNPGPQTFTVRLIVSGNNCIDTVTQIVNILIAGLPTPSIISINTSTPFTHCDATNSDPSFNLEVSNTTMGVVTEYVLVWGDNSVPDTINPPPAFTIQDHLYPKMGLFIISVIATNVNGCVDSTQYQFYNGNNPGGAIVPMNNMINCVPALVTYEIVGTQNNSPGTTYKITVNDGSAPVIYQHPPPATYTHLFLNSPCEPQFDNGTGVFNVAMEISNACKTVNGYTESFLLTPPEANFDLNQETGCEGDVFTVSNQSQEGFYFQNNDCSAEMFAFWSVDPPTGFTVLTGSLGGNSNIIGQSGSMAGFTARFDSPGYYNIRLIYRAGISNPCLRDTFIKTIQVLDAPVLNLAVDKDTVCLSDMVQVTNYSTGDALTYNWVSVPAGLIFLPNNTVPAPKIVFPANIPIGNYLITVQVGNQACGTLSWDTLIRMSHQPMVALDLIPIYCETATFTPTAQFNLPLDFIDSICWTFPGGVPSKATSFIPPTVAYSISGTYDVCVAVYNHCGFDQACQSFKILDGPEVNLAIDRDTVCQGDFIHVTNFSTGDELNYNWVSTPPGLVFIPNNPVSAPQIQVPTNLPSGNYILSVEVGNAACTPVFWDTLIRVGQSPAVTLGTIPNYCETASFTPTAQFGLPLDFIDSIRWWFPGGVPNTASGSITPSVTYSNPGIYEVCVAVYNFCGADTSCQTFKILDGPYVSIAIDRDLVCQGELVTVTNFSVGDELNYHWVSTPPGLVFLPSNTVAAPQVQVPANLPSGNYTVSVEVGNAECATLSWDTLIRAGHPPAVALDPIDDSCETATFTPTAQFSLPLDFIDSVQWWFPGGVPNTATGIIAPFVTYNNPGTYDVCVVVYNSCGTDTSCQIFKILDGSDVFIAIDRDTICQGDLVTVTNLSTGDGLTYNWVSTPPGLVFLPSNTVAAPQVQVPTNLPSGDYILSVEIGNAECASFFWDTLVRVGQLPAVALDPIPDYCETATFTPTAQFSLPIEFIDSVRWWFPGGLPSTASGSVAPTVNYTSPGIYEVCVAVYNFCGADTSCQTFINLQGPEIYLEIDRDTVCHGDFFPVTNLSTGDALNYNWVSTPPGFVFMPNNTASAPQIQVPTNLPSGDYILSVEIGNTVCSSVFWDTLIRVSEPPEVVLAPINDYCETATFTPTALFNLPLEFIDSVRWWFPGGLPNAATGIIAPSVTYTSPGTYEVCVAAYNLCGFNTACETFTILSVPELNLTVDRDTVTIGDTIFIINNTTEILSYLWTMAPATGVTISDILSPTPAFVFNGPPGIYTIGADISSPVCISNWQKEVVVLPFVHTNQVYVEPEIRLFPNPSDGNFMVRLSADIKPVQMELYDHLGQMLLRLYPDDIQSEEGYKIKFERRGAYCLRIVLGDQKSIVKNIVIH